MVTDNTNISVRERLISDPHITFELKQKLLEKMKNSSEEDLKALSKILDEYDHHFLEAYDSAIALLQPLTTNHKP